MKKQIEKMFNSIYEEYDLINNFITFGQHKNWKKQIVDISKSLNPRKNSRFYLESILLPYHQ